MSKIILIKHEYGHHLKKLMRLFPVTPKIDMQLFVQNAATPVFLQMTTARVAFINVRDVMQAKSIRL